MKSVIYTSILMFSILGSLVGSVYALEEEYFQKEYYSNSKREVSIIASPEGYYPSKVVVFAGEEVQFYVTGSKQFPSCFILEAADIFIPANPGEISEKKYKFERPGEFKFYCPQGKLTGSITVLEHPERVREAKLKRKIASEKSMSKVKLWRPKDE